MEDPQGTRSTQSLTDQYSSSRSGLLTRVKKDMGSVISSRRSPTPVKLGNSAVSLSDSDATLIRCTDSLEPVTSIRSAQRHQVVLHLFIRAIVQESYTFLLLGDVNTSLWSWDTTNTLNFVLSEGSSHSGRMLTRSTKLRTGSKIYCNRRPSFHFTGAYVNSS